MSRTGDCRDNAVAESFFSTFDFEFQGGHAWRHSRDAEPELFSFIEGYYDTERLHSWNGYRSPNETEATWRVRAQAA